MKNKLHLAIRDVLVTYGLELIRTPKLSNYLADYSAFKEVPASQQVLNTILASGYGDKLYVIKKNNLEWQSRLLKFTDEVSNQHGYRGDLVQYVFQCLAYGLNWVNKVNDYNIVIQSPEYFSPKQKQESYDVRKQLHSLKAEYLTMLAQLITVPKGRFIRKSGYYTANAESQLALAEERISIASHAIGEDNSKWCKEEKEKVLLQYRVGRASITSQFALIIGLFLIAGSFFAWNIGSYLYSLDSIKDYDEKMEIGNGFSSNQQYLKAYEAFRQAAEYDAPFKTTSHVENAKDKMTEMASALVKQEIELSRDMTLKGDLVGALKLLKKENSYRVRANQESIEALSSEIAQIESKLVSSISTGKNTLLLNLSANHGTLNKEGKDLLKRLLEMNPDDYWLNFINQKIK